MLSRVMNKSLMRGSQHLTKMVKPGQYVCFCGCTDGSHKGMSLTSTPFRSFQGHLNLDSTLSLVPRDFKASEQVALWKDLKHSKDNALVLKSNDEIE